MANFKTIWSAIACVALWPPLVAADDRTWKMHTEAGEEAYKQGNLDEAEKEFNRARQETDGLAFPDQRQAVSLENLAALYTIQGQYTAAEPLFLRAVAIGAKTAMADPREMAKILHNYGILLRKTKRKSEAAKMMAQADDLLKNNLPGKLAQHTVHARSLMSAGDSSVFDRTWR